MDKHRDTIKKYTKIWLFEIQFYQTWDLNWVEIALFIFNRINLIRRLHFISKNKHFFRFANFKIHSMISIPHTSQNHPKIDDLTVRWSFLWSIISNIDMAKIYDRKLNTRSIGITSSSLSCKCEMRNRMFWCLKTDIFQKAVSVRKSRFSLHLEKRFFWPVDFYRVKIAVYQFRKSTCLK